MKAPAIILLSSGGLKTAQKIQGAITEAAIYTPEKLEIENTFKYNSFREISKVLYEENIPLIFLCASGIVIRTLAPLLQDKFSEPPVLALSENGFSIVPLLGANSGANALAGQLASILDGHAAITTSGELRFGINLLYPPSDLKLLNPDDAKNFIARLLNGEKLTVKGNHPWLECATLPLEDAAELKIIINGSQSDISPQNLVYTEVAVPRERGRLSIIGIGPGHTAYLTPSAKKALREATDIMGYGYYIDLAGPFTPEQTVHKSDNREEIERAKSALEYAAQGKNVAVVSSGDPGIFAMAAAVMEVWEKEATFDDVDLVVEPGISAAFATAAVTGAPLGHDFAVISLSDNLKPWAIIEKRLKAALDSDLALALYNPVSKTRPHQISACLNLLKTHCEENRPIVIAHDVSRPEEKIIITTLGKLNPDDITSRSTLLVGSSQTRIFTKNGRNWVFTPRSYPFL